ncbi:MAG: Fur family transcriptional regulator [Candidatus Obscuribacterales bacterium]
MERNTQQRQAIFATFESSGRPLSVQEIHDIAKKTCRGLGIATVYRNLKALAEDGKIVSIEMPGGLVLYELPGAGHHHHFSCLSCQKVFDVQTCGLSFQKLLPDGFELVEHEVLLAGYCRSCKA